MHRQLPVRLEALFCARESGFCFLGGKKGERFNLLVGGRVYGREIRRIHMPCLCLQSSTASARSGLKQSRYQTGRTPVALRTEINPADLDARHKNAAGSLGIRLT